MDKKIVFFDIDGTIWDWKGIIPPSAKEAISRLKENGHIPIICTGRARGHVRNRELLDIGFPGIIAACGTHVEYEGKMLYESFLESRIVKEIIDYSKKCNVPIVLEGTVKHWVSPKGFEKDFFVDRMLLEMGEDIVWLEDYTEDMKINKFAGDILRASDFDPFREYIKSEMFLIEHSNGWDNDSESSEGNAVLGVFEGIQKGSSKADGIRRMCEFLGVDPKETYGFGDSKNDMDMIEYVGTGVAMGDGAEELKEASDYVTTGVWEDGIKNALEYFGLIGKY